MVTLASEPDGFERTEIVPAAAVGRDRLRVDAGPLQADETSLRVDLGRRLQARFDAAARVDPPASDRSGPRRWCRGWASTGRRTCSPRASPAATTAARSTARACTRRRTGAPRSPTTGGGARDRASRSRAGASTASRRRRWSPGPSARRSRWRRRSRARSRARAAASGTIRARSPRWRIEIEGAASGGLRLPVPLPSERRLELRSNHHLTGELEARVWRGRRLWLRTSGLAGLEDGAVNPRGS